MYYYGILNLSRAGFLLFILLKHSDFTQRTRHAEIMEFILVITLWANPKLRYGRV